eukprot:TRINITY_DN264_c0_g1_i3.p1 TRINITY_DN264_c0_g1~~TRINITY_DN264_c0_g1_i3.p1  ORF type:complete len:234 (+),score=22.15 TRINITY_DN264_c0_g1_i3:635-1336(+)
MAEAIAACPDVCPPGQYRKASCMVEGKLVPQKQQAPTNNNPPPPAPQNLETDANNPPPPGDGGNPPPGDPQPGQPAAGGEPKPVELDWAAVRRLNGSAITVLQTSACRECSKDFPAGSYDCSLGYLRPKAGYWCTVLGDERNPVPKGTLDFKLYKCPIEGACNAGECCFACRPNNTNVIRVPTTKADKNPDTDFGKPSPREECEEPRERVSEKTTLQIAHSVRSIVVNTIFFH